MFFRRAAITLAAALAWLEFTGVARAATVSAYWDDVAFNYVQQTNSAPQAARMLAIMHAARTFDGDPVVQQASAESVNQ
jgi:hypothetical protein